MKRTAAALCLLSIGLPALAAEQARTVQAPSGRSAAYSRDPNTVVVALVQEIAELRDEDPGPSVRVFGDGRALVHVPRYMKNAGDYEVHLSDAELDRLLTDIVEGRLPELDVSQLRGRRRAALQASQQRSGVVFDSTDETVSVLELNLERYGAARAQGSAVQRQIRWPGLESDAERLPELEELQALETVRSRLEAIMRRPDRVRIAPQR